MQRQTKRKGKELMERRMEVWTRRRKQRERERERERARGVIIHQVSGCAWQRRKLISTLCVHQLHRQASQGIPLACLWRRRRHTDTSTTQEHNSTKKIHTRRKPGSQTPDCGIHNSSYQHPREQTSKIRVQLWQANTPKMVVQYSTDQKYRPLVCTV